MEIQLRNINNLPKKTKREPYDDDYQENIIEEVQNLIETLNNMRFIEKISRPIDKRIKQEYVQKFAGKMEMLHHKLQKISTICGPKMQYEAANQNYAIKTKQSMQGSNTMKISDWCKKIRTIETRYVEVFMEGSFKHYKRLKAINNFQFELSTVNIHEWASNCLNMSEPSKKWCCC